MISVVIPLYNKEKQIRKTLETVLSQTFQDFEIVIVNDGSTDGSVDEVLELKDERIHLFHQTNAGVSAARNRGIKEAKGEYIAFLDADDEWKNKYLETQYNLTKQFKGCSVFATNYVFRKSNENLVPTIIRRIRYKECTGELDNYFEVASCSHPPLWTSAVMVTKEAIQEIGGFPVGIKSGEDLITWAKLACRYSIAYTKEALAIFNEGPEHSIENKPTRPHDNNDYVAEELIKLLSTSNKNLYPSFKKYISLWYKMKVSVYVRLGNINGVWRYGLKSLKFNWFNYKIYLMMIIVLLPTKLRQYIIRNY